MSSSDLKLKVKTNRKHYLFVKNVFEIIGTNYQLTLDDRCRFPEVYVTDKEVKYSKKRFTRAYRTFSEKDKSSRKVIPVVNQFIDHLHGAIKWLCMEQRVAFIQKWYWPKKAEFVAAVTHDIDETKPSILQSFHILRFLLKRKRFAKLVRFLFSSKSWDVNKILEIDDTLGIKASFFILVNQLKEKDAKKIIEEIVKRGHEVCLHGEFSRYKKEPKTLHEDLALMNSKSEICGFRSHYFKFEVPLLWEILERTRTMKYDSSLFCPENPGFRNGLAFPFYPNDLSHILEFPPAFMDASFFSARKNLEDLDGAKKILKLLIENVRKHHGLLVLLWHNDKLIERSCYPEVLPFFRKTIEELRKEKAYFMRLIEIYEWWKQREKTKIIIKKCGKRFRLRVSSLRNLYIRVFLPRVNIMSKKREVWLDASKGIDTTL